MGSTKLNFFIMITLGVMLAVNCMPRSRQTLEEDERIAQLSLARERSRNDRVQRVKSQIIASLQLQGKKVPTTDGMREKSSITKRTFRKMADAIDPTDDLDLIRLVDSEDDEKSVSYHVLSQSLYPNCLLPGEVESYLKIDEGNKNFHHIFFNMSQIGRNPNAKYIFSSATLTLFNQEMNPTKSPIGKEKLHVGVFMLRPTEYGHETVLIDEKYFIRYRVGNVNLNIATAVEAWHKHPEKNFGMLVVVSDENDEPVLFQNVFQKMDCSKNFTVNPFPARLAATISPSLMEKIYWKLNEFGTSTDIESFKEIGLNKNHLPLLDFVMRTYSNDDDQLNSGEQESEPEKSTSNFDGSDSLKNFPERSKGHYFHGPRPNIPTLKPCPIGCDKLEKFAKGNREKSGVMNMPADQPASMASEDDTIKSDEAIPKSSKHPMIIKRKDFVKLMLNFLENKN